MNIVPYKFANLLYSVQPFLLRNLQIKLFHCLSLASVTLFFVISQIYFEHFISIKNN